LWSVILLCWNNSLWFLQYQRHPLIYNFILDERSAHKSGKINKGILIDKEKENIVFKIGRFK